MKTAVLLLSVLGLAVGAPNNQGCQNVQQGRQKQFSVHLQEVNWYRAFELCRSYGKNLATILDEQENSRLKALLNTYTNPPVPYVWLSGTDLSQEGRYTWMSSGQSLTFTDWIKDEPNNADEAEHCLDMTKLHDPPVLEYGWNDFGCNKLSSFVCEYF